MANYITTYTKKHFTPLIPSKEDIDIADIAHALSLTVRANGHFPEFYSVAQHSIHCAEEAMARKADPRKVMLCLLHDASEAYIADVTRPLKENFKDYREVEEKLQAAIYEKFIGAVPDDREREFISMIDDALLYNEFLHYMGEKLFDEEKSLFSNPKFEMVPFCTVETEFLAIFDKLTKQLKELKKVKMIGLDLDGTLLMKDTNVSDNVRSVLKQAAEAGIEIVPASGRCLAGIPENVKSLPGVHYFVTTNGADVYTADGKCIYKASVPCNVAVDLLREIVENDVIVGAYIDGKGYMERTDFETSRERGLSENEYNYCKTTRKTVEDLPGFVGENGRDVQIITCHLPNASQELKDLIIGLIGRYEDLVCVWGGPDNIDITHKDASKGIALEKLAELTDTEFFAGFGDSGNDAQMLKKAKFGFAMGNGDDYAFAAADFIALANTEDGVADAISRLILEK